VLSFAPAVSGLRFPLPVFHDTGALSTVPHTPSGEYPMSQLTPEEERERIKGAPMGTFALMLLVGALLFAGWAFMFFNMFLPHGPVN